VLCPNTRIALNVGKAGIIGIILLGPTFNNYDWEIDPTYSQ